MCRAAAHSPKEEEEAAIFSYLSKDYTDIVDPFLSLSSCRNHQNVPPRTHKHTHTHTRIQPLVVVAIYVPLHTGSQALLLFLQCEHSRRSLVAETCFFFFVCPLTAIYKKKPLPIPFQSISMRLLLFLLLESFCVYYRTFYYSEHSTVAHT